MRFARPGAELLALDGNTYTLDGEMVAIHDDSGPQGIGGVMGGALTGCSEHTTNVFLEAALFEPVMVARTGRTLGILSAARYRFELGPAPQRIEKLRGREKWVSTARYRWGREPHKTQN